MTVGLQLHTLLITNVVCFAEPSTGQDSNIVLHSTPKYLQVQIIAQVHEW